MNFKVNAPSAVQTPPQTSATKTQATASQTVVEAGKLSTQDQLDLQLKHEKTKNMIVGIATIGGMLGGAGTMLTARSTSGMLVGMGIMGLGLMSGRIANGKDVASGTVAFVGAGAAIGIGTAVGAVTKKPLVGGIVAGAAIMGVLALSKSLEEK